jgi:hypothetical protein
MQPKVHSGFLQSLESVTEFSQFDSRGNGIRRFDRSRPETVEHRTLDWAAHAVLEAYNGSHGLEHPLTFDEVTRSVLTNVPL